MGAWRIWLGDVIMKIVIPRNIGLHPEGLEVARNNAIARRAEIANDRLAWAAAKREAVDAVLPSIPVREKTRPENLTMREHLEGMRTRLIDSPESEADRELALRENAILGIEAEASLRVTYGN